MEGLYRQSDSNDPARMVVCPKCLAAVTAACTEPARPSGHKYVDYYHEERTDLARKLQILE